MASSYLSNYCGAENLTVSRPQNISDFGYGVYQSPKRQKVYVDHKFSKSVSDDDEDNVGPVESDEGSADTGTFDDDSVFYETDDSVSSGSYTCTGMDGSDYDMIPETIIEHELISTEKVRPYVKRSVSAVRCFPPGCGINESEQQLEKELIESKNHWLTCKSCRLNDDDDEGSCADNEDLISDTNFQDCEIDYEKKRGTNENAISKMNNENCEKIGRRRPRARAGYVPRGCVVTLTEEDFKLAEAVLRKHM